MNVSQKYLPIINELKPFIYTYSDNLKNYNTQVLSDLKIFDPFNHEHKNFFKRIRTLDGLCFGGADMGMDPWVILDCAIMPGAIFGFGIESARASDEVLSLFSLTKEDVCFIPFSIFIAIPMGNKTHWFAHNLSSLNSRFTKPYKGLGLLTKLFGIKTLKIEKLIGATQWNNSSLYIHTKLSPLKVLNPKNPVHTHSNSFIYESVYDDNYLNSILEENTTLLDFDYEISSEDDSKISMLNEYVKDGKTITIVNTPIRDGAGLKLQIKESF
ncbi:MAG: hypothetical protein N4A33_12065 [Bacteriovoracaceae bacterium]|jgi:hypothetical protein|nr:hypothetical protein [Bacteriovoracaceae bacterium]